MWFGVRVVCLLASEQLLFCSQDRETCKRVHSGSEQCAAYIHSNCFVVLVLVTWCEMQFYKYAVIILATILSWLLQGRHVYHLLHSVHQHKFDENLLEL